MDFGGAEELARLAGDDTGQERAVPEWVLVAWAALKELGRAEWTGEPPGGRSWGRQPAWKVELWEAYWRGCGSGGGKAGDGAGRRPGS